MRNLLKSKQNHKGVRIVRSVLLITAYERFMKFVTGLSVVHQAVFADKYWPCAKKSYYLVSRNQRRAGVPQEAASYVIFYIKSSIMLAGLVAGYCMLLFRDRTFTGQLTVELSSFLGPVCFSGVGAWYISEVFGGAFEVCCTTTLFAASCDEEMNAREQRFADNDLLEFMDHMGQEQNAHERDAQGIRKARNHFDEEDSDDENLFKRTYKKNQIVPLYEEQALKPNKPELHSKTPKTDASPYKPSKGDAFGDDNMFIHRPNLPQARQPAILAASNSTWMTSGMTSRPQTGQSDEEEPDSSRPVFRKAKFV
jgi:hypothetical protein